MYVGYSYLVSLIFSCCKGKGFFIICKQIEEKNHLKPNNCKGRTALFFYFITLWCNQLTFFTVIHSSPFVPKALNNLKFTLPLPTGKQIIRIFANPTFSGSINKVTKLFRWKQ